MKQVVQDPSAREVVVLDVPPPALRPGTILVRNVCSAISPGTERSAVALSRSSYLQIARARPDLVRRMLETVRREGVVAAYRKAQARLGALQPLGYSSAGVVEAVGSGAEGLFRVGDRVACAGAGHASHAELVCVPTNLATVLPPSVPMDAAAFTTLGAIALHAVRQAEPTLGERFAVLGLGVVGQLAVQILRAHGARVAAFDLRREPVDLARELGADAAFAGDADEQVAAALAFTGGVGVDGVLVTAGSADDGPMVAAAAMARDRGRVVAVGLVPFGLPREIAYAKELDLRISRSYGPGRYDRAFEEDGVEYPVGYVRWTETGNMEAFVDLLASGRVEVARLVTRRFPVEEAHRAYEMLAAKDAPQPVGILLDYPEAARAGSATGPRTGGSAPKKAGAIGIAFVGAGGFAKSVLLPQLKGRDGVSLRRVVTEHGVTAEDARRSFGFAAAGTDAGEALGDGSTDLVCIATRHDAHADLVVRALRAGKHVFVEKPLALDEAQLAAIEEAAASSSRILLVGFNRRFSPMAVAVRDALRDRGPALFTYRVNAGALAAGHWLNDRRVGGGRLIGEGCHFVDLLSFLAGDCGIASVEAHAAGRSATPPESFAVQLSFSDGSAGQILYTASGSSSLSKERLEAHAGGVSAVLDDFRSLEIHSGRNVRRVSRGGKGHGEEMDALLRAVRAGGPSPIALATLLDVTRATFRAQAALSAP
jgi:predicted dehydrogenase/threonine dehydrogenase-like Zn-dependent dehydrogenase